MMKRQSAVMAMLLAVLLILSGCLAERSDNRAPQGDASPPETASPAPGVAGEAPAPVGQVLAGGYIDSLVQETVAGFSQPDMSEFEKVKAAFDYMIENTTLLDPVGLDLWRIRGDYGEPPSYLENRSLSVLLFQLGKCEDYAAALTLLLRGMGLEAEYVPGLTYSTQGALVDHAWTVVRVDGNWYHVDCQLEQNISRHGIVRYKYFMRGDANMAGSHRWGQNLIDARLLTAAQNEEIARYYTPPACPADYPTPAKKEVTLPEAPNVTAIQASIDAEFQDYERANGPLEPLESNTIPPVFALEGYGPQD